MMVEDLKQAGTCYVSTEVLKMSMNTGDSWSAQCFRVDGETESVPAALRGFCLLKIPLTSVSKMENGFTVGWGQGASEVWSCGEVQAPAGVGEVELKACNWWIESRGMVSGLSHCLSKWQYNSFRLFTACTKVRAHLTRRQFHAHCFTFHCMLCGLSFVYI